MMKANRYGIPEPPAHANHHHAFQQNSFSACYIWVFDDEGARIIETQYAQVREVMTEKRCARSTAYRLIAAQGRRYWVSDCRDPQNPRCYTVIPRRVLRGLQVLPVGNPLWHSGHYQRRLRLRHR